MLMRQASIPRMSILRPRILAPEASTLLTSRLSRKSLEVSSNAIARGRAPGWIAWWIGGSNSAPRVLLEGSALAQKVPLGGVLASESIELCDHVDLFRRADRLHLLEIGDARGIEVVVSREVHHHRPLLRRRLAGAGVLVRDHGCAP